jgi:hypothetical protein
MMNILYRHKTEEKRDLHRERGRPSADNGLDAFIERIQEDISKNMISEADGTSLIIMTTLLINMLSAP